MVACLSSVLPALLSISIHLGNGEERVTSLHGNTEAYTDIALTSEQCTAIHRLFTKDRRIIVIRKWNNMDKCCSI